MEKDKSCVIPRSGKQKHTKSVYYTKIRFTGLMLKVYLVLLMVLINPCHTLSFFIVNVNFTGCLTLVLSFEIILVALTSSIDKLLTFLSIKVVPRQGRFTWTGDLGLFTGRLWTWITNERKNYIVIWNMNDLLQEWDSKKLLYIYFYAISTCTYSVLYNKVWPFIIILALITSFSKK